jgi:hypothetical protein
MLLQIYNVGWVSVSHLACIGAGPRTSQGNGFSVDAGMGSLGPLLLLLPTSTLIIMLQTTTLRVACKGSPSPTAQLLGSG